MLHAEVYQSVTGKWTWCIRHPKGALIAVSVRTYVSKHNARQFARRIMNGLGPDAIVVVNNRKNWVHEHAKRQR